MGLISKLLGKDKAPKVSDLDSLMAAAEDLGSLLTKPEKRLSTKPKFRPRTKAGKKRKRLRQLAGKARRATRLAAQR